MRKSRPVLLRTEDPEHANRAVALLASMGIDCELHESRRGPELTVRVEPSQADAARELLREELLETSTAEEPRFSAGHGAVTTLPLPDLWFGPSAWIVYALAALCVGVHVYVHQGSELVDRARMIEMGAITYALVEQGESWRLFTAVFLHFDAAHLVSNLAVLLLVAPPLAYELGWARFLLVFLVAGMCGNAASHVLAPSAALKAGASGAIAGVIGGLGGYRLRASPDLRGRPWRIFAAMLAFYGMLIGFGPGRDNVAHVFGLLAGLVSGRALEPSSEAAR